MSNPGKMDRRVMLQERTLTQDATGSRVEAWEDIAAIWAEQVTHRGAVAPVADAERAQDVQQWRIRYRAITPAGSYRLTYKGLTYEVKSITEEGRKNTLLLDTLALQAVF